MNWLPVVIVIIVTIASTFMSFIVWFKPNSYREFVNDGYDRFPKNFPLTEILRRIAASNLQLWLLRIFFPLFSYIGGRILISILFKINYPE